MMGIGFWEMMLLAGIALVVIGPEKFPDFAKVVVRTVRDLRGYMDEVKRELSDELKPVEREMRSLTRVGSENLNQLRETINNPGKKAPVGATTQPSAVSDPPAQETKAEEAPSVVTEPNTAATAYGAYSPDTDEDYDHTVQEAAETETPEDENGGGITGARAPERLDG